MKAILLYIFRHGETAWNAEGRLQGHLDIPLNDRGRSQAQRLQPVMRRLGVEAILSSDLSRARETAEIAAVKAAAAPLTVHTTEGLREIHMGRAQGMTREEVNVSFGIDLSHRLMRTPLSEQDVMALGCEASEAVTARAVLAIAEFARQSAFTRVGVSTHGGIVRRLLHVALGEFPPSVGNGVVYPVRFVAPVAGSVEGARLELLDSLPLGD